MKSKKNNFFAPTLFSINDFLPFFIYLHCTEQNVIFFFEEKLPPSFYFCSCNFQSKCILF